MQLTVSVGVAEAITSMPGVDALMKAAPRSIRPRKAAAIAHSAGCLAPPLAANRTAPRAMAVLLGDDPTGPGFGRSQSQLRRVPLQ